MKPSARHTRDAALLIEFRDAYIDLVNAAQQVQPLFITQLAPAVDAATWNIKRHRVAVTCGAALLAYGRHGNHVTLHNAAYVVSNLNPVAGWETSLRDPEQLPPATLVSYVETAAGFAQQRAKEAQEREHGITGRIAAVLRWPSDLREAVGPGQAQRTVATVVGVVGQVLVGALSLALGTGIVAGAIALVRLA